MKNVTPVDVAPSTVIIPRGFALSTERLLRRGVWVSDGFEVAPWPLVPDPINPPSSSVAVSWTTRTGSREAVQVFRASAHRGGEIAERLANRGLRIAPDQHGALCEFFALVIAR